MAGEGVCSQERSGRRRRRRKDWRPIGPGKKTTSKKKEELGTFQNLE